MLRFNDTPPLFIKEAVKKGYVEVYPGDCWDWSFPNSDLRRGRLCRDKMHTLMHGNNEYYTYLLLDMANDKVKLERLRSRCASDKQGVEIEIGDKKYVAFIRRLTPGECAKLQTIPDNYKFVSSESQTYKCLGNGWTVEVIKHCYSFIPKEILYGKEKE